MPVQSTFLQDVCARAPGARAGAPARHSVKIEAEKEETKEKIHSRHKLTHADFLSKNENTKNISPGSGVHTKVDTKILAMCMVNLRCKNLSTTRDPFAR
jgi:hypothetical protein